MVKSVHTAASYAELPASRFSSASTPFLFLLFSLQLSLSFFPIPNQEFRKNISLPYLILNSSVNLFLFLCGFIISPS